MATYKTPGVYVEEISLLPPSVAQVETAIPAFIGYTKWAEKDGQDLTNVPTRITSMLEYQAYFGNGRSFAASDFELKLDEGNNYRVVAGSFKLAKQLNMYNTLRQYFDNGGGPCYIVSVGSYEDTIAAGDENAPDGGGLRVGLKAVEKYDEPTLLILPDAANLGSNEFYALQQMAIAQAGFLGDRFAVLDLREYDGKGSQQYFKASQMAGVYQEFRDRIGINDLKYAAAYTPWLQSSYTPNLPYAVFKANVKKTDGTAIDFLTASADPALNALVRKAEDANSDLARVNDRINANNDSSASQQDQYQKLRGALLGTADATSAATDFNNLLDFIRAVALEIPKWRGSSQFASSQLLNDLDASAKDTSAGLAASLRALLGLEKNAGIKDLAAEGFDYGAYDEAGVKSWWNGFADADYDPDNASIANFKANTTDYVGDDDKATALAAVLDLDKIFNGLNAFMVKVQRSAAKYAETSQNALYGSHPIISAAVSALQMQLAIVPPAGAVAGIYAKTDRERGVWKAPANSSLNSVVAPMVMIDNTTQDGLNVDADAGKSINAIRAFSGKGTLVWGARTLDGNSNEWRYVPVRRLYNMVEESVRKSTYPFVFEANDANTWVKVKGMIDNYLTTLWRQGALAGAKPEHAFFVRVGLGQTMTALDILEGRMNVEIGMAAVRPAEFIILKFSHKMQES